MISLADSLWVPGWGTDAAVWQSLCGAVPPAADFSGVREPEDLVEAVVQAAEARGSTTLVGWSLGGMLVLAAAPRLSRVSRCILIATAPVFVRQPDFAGWPAAVLRRMAAACREDPIGTQKRFLGEHLAGHELPVGTVPPAQLLAGLAFLAEAELRDMAASLAVPTLWLHGSADSLYPPPAQATVQSWLPRAALTFHCFDGLGHAPFLDDPDRCRRAIADVF